MKEWARDIKQNALMRWNGVFNFQQKINLFIRSGSYILKTAETHEELLASFKLRHEVFFQEFQSIDFEGFEFDKFDTHFDHLIIVDEKTEKVVGTYRLNCSNYSALSYTELEFHMKDVFDYPGPHLELGRACIHKDHRKGTVLSLLWRGVTDYMHLSGAKILYGCSSIKISTTSEAALVYRYLYEKNSLSDSFDCRPTKKYKMKDFEISYHAYKDGLTLEQKEAAEKMIPPLLKSYIKLGAKIGSEPAYDEEFACVDLLTILKKEDMSNSLARRFQLIQ